MNFLSAFGIDGWLIYAQIVNFVILMGILSIFFYAPVLREMKKEDDRRKKLAEDEAVHAKFVEERKQMLTEAKTKAQGIIEEAETIAQDIKRRTSEEAQKEKAAAFKQFTDHMNRSSHQS